MFSFLKQNKKIVVFFIKLIVLVVVTISIHTLFLKPQRIPDKWLTNIIADGVVVGVNTFFPEALHITSDPDANNPLVVNIRQNGKTFLRIWDDCNGLDLIAIYLGLIILLPYKFARKLIFGIVGTVVIIIANIIRCIALYWIFIYHRSMFDFNHHYLFTILIYLLIFYGWLLFTKKGRVYEVG